MMTRLETTLETRLEKSKDTEGRTAKKATKLFWVESFAAKISQNLQLNNSSFQDFTIKVTNHNEHNCCLFHKEKSERGCWEREREKGEIHGIVSSLLAAFLAIAFSFSSASCFLTL
jgi:hypothetical protein